MFGYKHKHGKQSYYLIILTFLWLVCLSCEKEKDKIKIIGEPSIELLSPIEVLVFWETDIPGNSIVFYGLDTDMEESASDEEQREIHSVVISDLQGGTKYYYRVRSESALAKTKVTSGVGEFETGMNEESITLTGWEWFAQNQLDSADYYFQQALTINEEYAWAYVGLGWNHLRRSALENALIQFDIGLTYQGDLSDGRVGRAAVKLALSDYSAAISDCNFVLNDNPEYVFEFDTTIDYRDIRIILAQSYYALEDFTAAQAQCDLLDPDNGLDPALPATWMVDSNYYDTYLLALLNLINFLDTLY